MIKRAIALWRVAQALLEEANRLTVRIGQAQDAAGGNLAELQAAFDAKNSEVRG